MLAMWHLLARECKRPVARFGQHAVVMRRCSAVVFAEQPRAEDALLAAVRSNSFEGSTQEGIWAKLRTRSAYAPRKVLVEEVLKLVTSKGMLILKGPPLAGKTSLLQLLFLRAYEVREVELRRPPLLLSPRDGVCYSTPNGRPER